MSLTLNEHSRIFSNWRTKWSSSSSIETSIFQFINNVRDLWADHLHSPSIDACWTAARLGRRLENKRTPQFPVATVAPSRPPVFDYWRAPPTIRSVIVTPRNKWDKRIMKKIAFRTSRFWPSHKLNASPINLRVSTHCGIVHFMS